MLKANAAVLDIVCGVLDTIADPAHRPGVQRAVNELSAPNGAESDRIAELERQIAKSQKRLSDALVMLADREIDQTEYAMLRDSQKTAIDAATIELRRISVAQPAVTRLPSAQALFDQAGSWSTVLRNVEVPEQRKVLEKLVESVVITKTGWRQHCASITWSPLGARLADIAGAVPAV